MARLPYANFHDLNLDWVIKQVRTAYTKDNPPPYPVRSVNGLAGDVEVTGDVIPIAPNNAEMVSDAIRAKQDAPASPGNPGQVLGLDQNSNPAWVNQSGGVTSYDELTGKPSINGVPLSGEMEGSDIGLIDAPTTPGTAGQVLTSDGQGKQNWGNLPDYSDVYAPIIRDTASGAPASFPDGMANMAMNVIASIIPIQDLHGYNNPWPAGGGTNLAKPQVPASNQYYDFANDNGVYSITRKADMTTNPRQFFTATFGDIGLEDGETYTAYCFEDEQYTYKCGLYNGSGGMAVLDIHTTAYTFTYSESTMSVYRLGVWTNSPNTLPLNTTISFRAMLVKGSTTPTLFATYSNICPISGHAGLTLYTSGADTSNPDVYPFAWGDVSGRVYGGQLEVKADGSCRLTATHAIINIDENSSVYEYAPARGFYTVSISSYKSPATNIIDSIYCDKLKTVARTGQVAGNTYQISGADVNTAYIGIQLSPDYNTLALCKTWLQNNNLQVVYPLENPIVYDMPSINTLRSLFGTNNIWSDVGPVSAEYYADTKLFILKVIA